MSRIDMCASTQPYGLRCSIHHSRKVIPARGEAARPDMIAPEKDAGFRLRR
jgi:hypothetical protein